MIIFDAHNDTLVRAKEGKASLFDNDFHIDFNRLKQKEEMEYALCSAIFIHPKNSGEYLKKASQVIDYLENVIHSKRDEGGFLQCNKQVSMVLSLEGAHVLEGNVQNVDYFYNRGIRVISLTWNYNNELAGGCNDKDFGITALGKSILERMESLEIILDVSHISTKSFYEVFEFFNGKIIASHSNSYKICNHVRNLTDDQIIKLSKRGGVIGINFYPEFLTSDINANISHIIKNIEYIAALGGIGSVGLGADFDGVDKLPLGINGIEDIDKIINELVKLNYKGNDIEAIMGRNFLDIFKI